MGKGIHSILVKFCCVSLFRDRIYPEQREGSRLVGIKSCVKILRLKPQDRFCRETRQNLVRNIFFALLFLVSCSGGTGGDFPVNPDKTPPRIKEISSSSPDGRYHADTAPISVLIYFDEAVVVGEGANLLLNTGRMAPYISGSGTEVLTFQYVPHVGDFVLRLDIASKDALSLGGGKITDVAGNEGSLSLPEPGSPDSLGTKKNFFIDGESPGCRLPPCAIPRGQGTGAFSEVISVGSSRHTYALSLGDINGDRHLDLITGNTSGETNQVFLGKGDGTFREPFNLTSDAHWTFSLATGDLNGDGKLDVVAGNSNVDPSRIYLGQGDGSFAGSDLGGEFINTRGVVLGDFNNDGKLDVIFAIWGGAPKIYLGNGNGTMGDGKDITSDSRLTQSLMASDVNQDGHLDLIAANNASTNRVYLGKGDGTFREGLDLSSDEDDTQSLALADIDGDKKLDVLVSRWGKKVLILLGNGDGTFRRGNEVTPLFSPSIPIAVTDLNQDGFFDFVLGVFGSDVSKVFLGIGGGSFGEPKDVGSTKDLTHALALGDLNKDGKLDIVFGNGGSGGAKPSRVALGR